MKSLISWKSITGAFALVVGVYLFSPLVSEDCFGFSQEVKACDVACLLVPGLVLLLWGNARAGVVKVSAIDVWFLLYAVYLFVRALLVWEETDRGVLVEYVACGGLYVVLRNADWRAVRYPVVVLCCAGVLLWQFWYGVAVQTDYFFPGKSVARVCGSFFNVNLWSCFVACVGVGLCARLFSSCSPWDGVPYAPPERGPACRSCPRGAHGSSAGAPDPGHHLQRVRLWGPVCGTDAGRPAGSSVL